MNKTVYRLFLWICGAFLLLAIFNLYSPREPAAPAMNYSDFINELNTGNIRSITASGIEIKGTLNDGTAFKTNLLQPLTHDSSLTKDLLDKKVVIISKPEEQPGLLFHLLNLLPWLILAFLFYSFKSKENIQKKDQN